MHRQRKHSDMLVFNPPVPAPALAYACTLCDMSFSTEVGLTQHKRHKHPIEYNAEKLDRIKPSTQRCKINRPMHMDSNDANAPRTQSCTMKLFRTWSMLLVTHLIGTDRSLRPPMVFPHNLSKHDSVIMNCSDYVDTILSGETANINAEVVLERHSLQYMPHCYERSRPLINRFRPATTKKATTTASICAHTDSFTPIASKTQLIRY